MVTALENYRRLLDKVSELCRSIESALGSQITCSAGCSSCCTAITIFPLEAAVLREELSTLPARQRETITEHVSVHADGERCPLLFRQRCLLYNARPVICRTHGLPIIYSEGGVRKSDCCPLNMKEATTTAGVNVIDLDRLNALLVAINALFLTQSGLPEAAERLTIAEAVCGTGNSVEKNLVARNSSE